ncbi:MULTISPECIES: ArnT family glycosyltransferase [Deefgea]|uniref:Uncharacterized protein n=1 Tax=Deefgea chitinilytica TaxID=570276 RepID=A0ABS2C9I2_9NEIS|nr:MULTISPECIES: hypothetical protein [Deefgea]MBM5570021.1 hypothetical protein [Deefgea chitinilytica]MBM9887250.1 hypothetical protein [Deefgea sp. CFH1-16]
MFQAIVKKSSYWDFINSRRSILFVAFVFALFGLFVFLTKAKQGINTFEFGDESEKFVAAQMINEGMRLYLDIFAHHGPVPYIISHAYSVLISASDFSQIRWFMVVLALVSAVSIYLSPVFKSTSVKLIGTGIFLTLLSVIWVLQGTHMILYHQIGGFLFVIVFSQLFLPLVLGERATNWGIVISGFSAVTMCFTAYAFGLSVIFVSTASVLLAYRLAGISYAKSSLLLFFLGASFALAIILLWLYSFADLKGFLVYHFYFNQEVYSQFIGFSLSSLRNLFVFRFNPDRILHSFILIMLIASAFMALSVVGFADQNKNTLLLWLSVFLFALSIVFLSPRGGTGFHGVGFMIAGLGIFSATSSLFLQKYICKSGPNAFFRFLFGFLIVLFIFNKASSDAISSPHGVKSEDFPKYISYMRPDFDTGLVSLIANSKNDFLALIFNPSIYIKNGVLPVSGHYYYLPWQAAYNRNPIDGYKIDLCGDIKERKPSLIWFDNWKVWDKYAMTDYEPCVIDLINSNYTRTSDSSPLYVRSDRLINSSEAIFLRERRMVPSKQLEVADPIKLHLVFDGRKNPQSLENIGIMFGTHMRKNAGEAELVVFSSDGSKFSKKFSLPDLTDNHYRYFDLGVSEVVSAEIHFFSGGGVSTWESHDDSGNILTCINYKYSNKSVSFTPGCP